MDPTLEEVVAAEAMRFGTKGYMQVDKILHRSSTEVHIYLTDPFNHDNCLLLKCTRITTPPPLPQWSVKVIR